MARKFIYENREFPDPDPNMSPEEVRDSLADFYKELNNSEVRAETAGMDTIYRFERRTGVKGRGSRKDPRPGAASPRDAAEGGGPPGETSYRGMRGPQGPMVQVLQDGSPSPLDPRLDLRDHAPSGMEWGYGGSGPSQLALAILAHATGDEPYALANYQDFKWEIIAPMDSREWTMEQRNVMDWVKQHP